MGAGVCLLGMFVTITVLDATNLPQAVAATEAAAESSKVRLRLLIGIPGRRLRCDFALWHLSTHPGPALMVCTRRRGRP